MGKIRKSKLSWTHSKSDQVVDYKLYWSKENKLTYDSSFVEIGKVNEVYLPEILKNVPLYDEPIFLGLTAVDNKGQESDIAMFAEPYQAMAPLEPVDLLLTILDDFNVVDQKMQAISHYNELADEDIQDEEWEEVGRIPKPLIKSDPPEEKVKYCVLSVSAREKIK